MPREIPLGSRKYLGLVAVVDDEDYEELKKFWWSVKKGRKTFYAHRLETREDGTRHIVYMHQVILGVTNGSLVDHWNGDGLRNTRDNLRMATHSDNCVNRDTFKNNTSGKTGVYLNKKTGEWKVQINRGGKRFYLGRHSSFEEAVEVRNDWEKKLFGEFRPTKRGDGRG